MKQGAVITEGITNWQVLQRTGGFARVRVAGWFHVDGLPARTEMAVQARVVREDSGETVVGWTACAVEGLNFYVWLKIPAGGLYRLETVLKYAGANGLSVTRGDMAHHFGVGDVYVIAGQSNAAGRSAEPTPDPPEPGVHVLRPGGVWDMASHPLHETTNAVLTPSMENNNPAHSPFLAFGRKMRAALSVPIGLIPLAKGGSGLWQWNPDEEGCLYQNMLHTVRQHCPKVCGVLWYQGCADAFEHKGETYLARFARMVERWRADLGMPDLPFFTAQLNRCTMETDDALDASWGKVREAQRQAARLIPGVFLTPTADLPLFDVVHLNARANVLLGERMADMALGAAHGIDVSWKAPEAVSAQKTGQDAVRLTIEGADEGLTLLHGGRPAFSAEDDSGPVAASACRAEPGALTLTFPRMLGPGTRLHGVWQMNPAKPPVRPGDGLPLISFYGLKVEDTP